jgi:hypothetical protein
MNIELLFILYYYKKIGYILLIHVLR